MKNWYQENAFRLLGLPANATWIIVQHARQSLNVRVKAGGFYSVDDPLSFLNTVERNESSIRNAFNRLKKPQLRLRERLFWFTNTAPTGDKAFARLKDNDVEGAIQTWESEKNITSYANLARLFHSLCLFTDPNAKKPDLWKTALSKWRVVIENDDFWEYFRDIESESEFDPPATLSEINKLRHECWGLILDPSITIIRDAINNRRDEVARSHLNVIRNSNLSSYVLRDIELKSLSPIENEIRKTADDILQQLTSNINKFEDSENKTEEQTKNVTLACDKAYQTFKDHLFFQMERLVQLAGSGSDVAKRTQETVASGLRDIAVVGYHNAAEAYQTAERVLEEAISLIPENHLAERWEEEDLPILKKHAHQEKILKDLKPTKKAPSLYAAYGIGTTLYGKADYDPETDSYLASLYFVILFIPIFPIARYRVIQEGENTYRFLGKAPLRNFDKLHIGLVILFIGALFFKGNFITQTNYSGQKSSTPYSVQNEKSKPSFSNTQKSTKMKILKLKSQIESAKLELDRQKLKLEEMTGKLENYREQIEFYNSKLKRMKEEYNLGQAINHEEYNTMINKYNNYINLYNPLLRQFQLKYNEYKKLFEETNLEIAQYNELIRR